MFSRKHDNHSSTSRDTSLIARGTIIRGDVCFSGALHLDGCIEGCVQGTGDDAGVALSEHGQVRGDIRVPHAVINGQVHGDVFVTKRSELASQARVTGDVTYLVSERPARTGRNPATGETMQIAAKRVAKFSAVEALRDAAA